MRAPDELLARRAKLLASTGLDWAELKSRAEAWELTPDQRDAYNGIDSMDYLLGAANETHPAAPPCLTEPVS